MTNLQSDNPLLQIRLWMYDILWQYWPIVLPLHLARRTSPRVALAKVAARAAVRLAESWRDEGKPHAAFRPIGKK